MPPKYFIPVIVEKQRKDFTGKLQHLKIFTSLLAKEGVEGWNEWLLKNKTKKIDLSGIDLTGLNLGGLEFRNANLKKARFSNCRMWQARMIN